ncbi:Rpl30, partial [Symbiodinium natans]
MLAEADAATAAPLMVVIGEREPISHSVEVQFEVSMHKALGGQARATKWQTAFWLAQQMQEDGILPNSITTTLLLVACRPRRWRSALVLLASAVSLAAWNVALGLAPTPRLAFKWLCDMTQSALRPDPVSFGAVTASASALCGTASATSFWHYALFTMDLGRSCLGERPLPSARCAALTALARGAHWLAARQALASTVSPTVEELNAATSAVERWADAVAIVFGQRGQSLRPDAIGRNAASTACARAARWQEVYALTFRLGKPDAIGIGASFSALAAGAAVPQAWCWAWGLLAATQSQGVLLDTLALNAAAALPRWDRAAALLATFPARQLKPTSSTVATVLSSLGDRALWENALDLLAARGASDTTPANAGMAACDRGGAWQQALCLLAGRGLRRDEVGLGAAQSAVGKSGDWAGALSLLNEGRLSSLRVTDVSLAAALASSREVWKVAVSLQDWAAKQHLEVAELARLALLAATGAAGVWTRSLMLWPASLGSAGETTLRSTNAAVSSCVLSAAWPWAVRLVGEVSQLEMSQTAITQQAALAAFEASGQCRRAVAVLE